MYESNIGGCSLKIEFQGSKGMTELAAHICGKQNCHDLYDRRAHATLPTAAERTIKIPMILGDHLP
jgi:hypothetical protein